MKLFSFTGAALAALMLSACGGAAEGSLDDSNSELELGTLSSESELGTLSEALTRGWGGSQPGSCLDRCLSLCPKDAEGGIEAGCLLTCLGACSSPRSVAVVQAVR